MDLAVWLMQVGATKLLAHALGVIALMASDHVRASDHSPVNTVLPPQERSRPRSIY